MHRVFYQSTEMVFPLMTTLFSGSSFNPRPLSFSFRELPLRFQQCEFRFFRVDHVGLFP